MVDVITAVKTESEKCLCIAYQSQPVDTGSWEIVHRTISGYMVVETACMLVSLKHLRHQHCRQPGTSVQEHSHGEGKLASQSGRLISTGLILPLSVLIMKLLKNNTTELWDAVSGLGPVGDLLLLDSHAKCVVCKVSRVSMRSARVGEVMKSVGALDTAALSRKQPLL